MLHDQFVFSDRVVEYLYCSLNQCSHCHSHILLQSCHMFHSHIQEYNLKEQKCYVQYCIKKRKLEGYCHRYVTELDKPLALTNLDPSLRDNYDNLLGNIHTTCELVLHQCI